MKKFDCICEDCQTKVAEAEFEDKYSDEHCKERTEKGYLCEACAAARPAQEPITIEMVEAQIQALTLVLEELKKQ